jgi:hypothetical protein
MGRREQGRKRSGHAHRPPQSELIREVVNAMLPVLARSVITSAAASATTGAALMLLGRHERRGALAPLNASSHWLYGDHVGRQRRADLARTGVGVGTHHLAIMFWSVALEAALGREKKTLPELALAGALTAATAAAFDYLVVPRRLSPGWELALTRKSMAGAFGAMALGLAAGAAAARIRR